MPSVTPQLEPDIEQALYAKRQKIYPRAVSGIFAKLRGSSVLLLLGFYYITPWLQWNSQQAILFDLPARKFHILGITIWPQDLIYLTAILILAALSLFFFTALAGRLWCGFSCPQTVWTEAFLWMERKIEGSAQQQRKLDGQGFSARKLRIKSTKHFVWLSFSLWTGFTFVGYFTPIRELGGNIIPYALGPWETFWILFYGLATYGNAGWLREQVCTYMCPYARFQSAMIDKDTLIISYDKQRGDPRGARKRSTDLEQANLGHCIDCTICVQVCPTGIDIRDGLQYQCIGCAACIDACDDVMDKMGYPKGLVRYTTENTLEGKPTNIFRPRVIFYAVVLAAIAVAVVVSLLTRSMLDFDILRDRNSLFREALNGNIENVYTLKLINKDDAEHRLKVTVEGIEGIKLLTDSEPGVVASGEVIEYPVRVQAPPSSMREQSTDISFTVSAEDEPTLSLTEEARFVGPRPGQW